MTNQLGDLGDDGVPIGISRCHRAGKPIIHPSKLGECVLPISVPRHGLDEPPHSSKRPEVWFLPPFTPLGVGNNPSAISPVRRTNKGCWYRLPFRIIPARGKAPENIKQASGWKSPGILHDNVHGSNFANETVKFVPKAAALILKTLALSRLADALTRETPCDDIDGNSVSGQSVGCEFSDIFILLYVGPVLGEDLAAERINLAERDSGKPLGSL